MSRRHQIENADLRSDKPRGMSRQSLRREALNLTKRARAAKVHAQPITNFFPVSHTFTFYFTVHSAIGYCRDPQKSKN